MADTRHLFLTGACLVASVAISYLLLRRAGLATAPPTTPSCPMPALRPLDVDDALFEGDPSVREMVATLRRRSDVAARVGNTRLIELTSLSRLTGCRIFAKTEWENPGGSNKDRVALEIIADALATGKISPGGTIFEGTAGSTGISLAMLARPLGISAHILVPSDQAKEKTDLLESLGAVVERVPPVSFSNPDHFCKKAQRMASEHPNALFADQFDNLANTRAHYHSTGLEIVAQLRELGIDGPDVFVAASGTGGTLAGIARRLRRETANATTIVLADPQGSSLFNHVVNGVLYSSTEAEGRRKRNQVDSITEGVGISGRLTGNFRLADPDAALRVSDQEAVDMSRFLKQHEDIFVGSSSSVNVFATVKTALSLGPGHVLVTLLCDSGERHRSKFWNPEFLAAEGLMEPEPTMMPDFANGARLRPARGRPWPRPDQRASAPVMA
ncbi:hypothetical protein H696_01553 [Fonticula alba]|uniref:Tryptophan synthase beta chain-like PALP domain-containing protein n=1 Tax=Fonticula alba TaxID=691883 RepID=A0A058ZCP2_FONAL|nr:hypothetical protein H696_01553 [Fonticula alba]KCV72149.1 hypothetical protein H696_01553 [Fonticula alba]|eukprot:XP_009493727.1 hypothetical protein H696_01553 [Fonticula alba]